LILFGERGLFLANLDNILSFSKNVEKVRETHAVSLFGELSLEKPKVRLEPAIPATKKARLDWEKELLGLYVSDHPLSGYASYLAETTLPIREIANQDDEISVRLGGVIATVKKIISKNGAPMFFIGLEDLTGRTELVIFPRIAEKTEAFWKEGGIVIVDGKISRRDGEAKVITDSVTPLSEEDVNRFRNAQAMRKNSQQPAVNKKQYIESQTEKIMTIFLDTEKGTGSHRQNLRNTEECPDG
jgi:DNA polymerase-3 subunit alpha